MVIAEMAKSNCEVSIQSWNDMRVFQGRTVLVAHRLQWRETANHMVAGSYWVGIDDNGISWVSDGQDCMAVLPSRIFRFYRSGIQRRFTYLKARYFPSVPSLPQGANIINIGANIGEVAVFLATEGNAKVMAIEPDPNVLPFLCANAKGRFIDVVQAAAWDADDMLPLYLKSDSADSSAFNPTDHKIMVPCRKIDTLVKARGIERVHLIIGDAEGSEPEVLRGASETLKFTDYVSICASAERTGERTQEACESILTEAGFEIVRREASGFSTLVARNVALAQEAA